MGFRGKQILLLTVVAAAVALSTCVLNAALLARSRVDQLHGAALLVGRTLYHSSSAAIRRAESASLEDVLRDEPGLRDYADAVIGYSPVTLYLAIVDRDGRALFHSNPSFEGSTLREETSIEEFAGRRIFPILWDLWREDRALVLDLPFSVEGEERFGSVRVAVSTVLLRRPLFRAVAVNALIATGAVILVLLVSFSLANRLLAPIEFLREELSKIPESRGEPPFDFDSAEGVGRVAQFFSSVSDRLADEPAEERPDWLPAMLDGLSDAVIVLDRERRVLSLNVKARERLALPEGAPEGVAIERLLPAEHPVARAVHEAFERNEDVVRRPCTLTRDGVEVAHALTVRVLRRERASEGLIVTLRDLDQLSRIASRLSYSQKLASLGRLTSGVAHEIKNPLNAIVMQSALLRRKLSTPDGDLARHLDVLDEEVRRLDRVVLGFLAFSRPDELRLEAVDLGRVLRSALDKTCGDADTNGIRVAFESPSFTAIATGDAAMLEQVFSNLFANAREAMPEGGTLGIRLTREEDGIAVTVSDTGVGIPEESIADVFGLYYTTKEKGSGIGLSIVYRIVQLHGGEVSVSSEPGRGTNVEVWLPEPQP